LSTPPGRGRSSLLIETIEDAVFQRVRHRLDAEDILVSHEVKSAQQLA
jgi:hypothetical protein